MDYLKGHDIDQQHFEHNGYPSILMLPRPGYAPVLLMSHINVVDAPDKLFEPVEKNGNLTTGSTLLWKKRPGYKVLDKTTEIAETAEVGTIIGGYVFSAYSAHSAVIFS